MFGLMCILVQTAGFGLAAAWADSWDSAARMIAAELAGPAAGMDAIVTHVDADAACVYFSGLGGSGVETGAAVIFFRETDSGSVEIGSGAVESSRGMLAWASVDPAVGALVHEDDRVRPRRAVSEILVTPFYFQSSDGRRFSLSISRVFQSLVMHDLREQHVRADPLDAPADGWDGNFAPSSALAGRVSSGTAVLTGIIRATGETELTARVAAFRPADRGTEKIMDQTYRLDFSVGMDFLEEMEAPAQTVPADDETEPSASVAPGLLRLSLPTRPGGPDGGPAWPPRTPADRTILAAISSAPPEPDSPLAAYPKTPPGFDSGPYRIHAVSPSEIVLSRRTESGDADGAAADTIVFFVDTDARSRLERFELGDVDVHEMTDAEFSRFTGSTTYLNRIVRGKSGTLMLILFRLSQPVVGDLSFRKAVAYAVDRRSTLDVLLNNRGTLAAGFLPAAAPAPSAGRTLKMPDRSIAKARALIGNPRKPVRVRLLIPAEDPAFSLVAERIQADLKSLNVLLSIDRAPWERYSDRMMSGQFEMALASWPRSGSAKNWLARRFHSAGPGNVTGYANAAFDGLCSSDASIDRAAEMLLIDMPAIPLFYLTTYAVLGDRAASAEFEFDPASSPAGIRLAR